MHPARRTISAGYTLLAKLFAAVWIVGFGVGTLAMFVFGASRSETPTLQFLLLWLLGSGFLFWSALRLKKVSIDGDFLCVSNYLKSISIPISQIIEITDASILPGLQLIVMRLQSPTEFGDKVVFQPTSRAAVRALREAATQRKIAVASNGV